MNLSDALEAIAGQLDISASDLLTYAQEDTRPSGSMPYVEECQVLYALVRALKPRRVLEMGTHKGGSATHIAAALQQNYEENRTEHRPYVTCVDINPNAGSDIPPGLLGRYVLMEITDIDEYIRRPGVSHFDFIFEDGAHSEFQVHTIYERLDKLLAPGGVIVSHDAAVEGVRDFIAAGIRKGIGVDVPVYTVDPSPLGFTVYRR
jgi:predicted O-methyltransferase YrrM